MSLLRKERFKEWLEDSPLEKSSMSNTPHQTLYDPLLRPKLHHDPLDQQFIGSSSKVEKDYFRLTRIATPDEVRPLPVLKQAYQNAIDKYSTGIKDYTWFNSQFKAIRQDCLLQGIQNDFLILVFETNTRISLYHDDYFQVSQCLNHVTNLYDDYLETWYELERNEIVANNNSKSVTKPQSVSKKKVNPNEDDEPLAPEKHPNIVCINREEFITYRLLVACLSSKNDNTKTQHLVMSSLLYSDFILPGVQFALKIRECLSVNNYKTFFQLYFNAPWLTRLILKELVVNFRRTAFHMMLVGAKPTLDVLNLLQYLGFLPPQFVQYNPLFEENQKFIQSTLSPQHDPTSSQYNSQSTHITMKNDQHTLLTSRIFSKNARHRVLLISTDQQRSYDESLGLFEYHPSIAFFEQALKALVEFMNEHTISRDLYTLPEYTPLIPVDYISPQTRIDFNSQDITSKKKKNKILVFDDDPDYIKNKASRDINNVATDTISLSQYEIGTTEGPVAWLGEALPYSSNTSNVDHLAVKITKNIVIQTRGALKADIALTNFVAWQRDHNSTMKAKQYKQLTVAKQEEEIASNSHPSNTQRKKIIVIPKGKEDNNITDESENEFFSAKKRVNSINQSVIPIDQSPLIQAQKKQKLDAHCLSSNKVQLNSADDPSSSFSKNEYATPNQLQQQNNHQPLQNQWNQQNNQLLSNQQQWLPHHINAQSNQWNSNQPSSQPPSQPPNQFQSSSNQPTQQWNIANLQQHQNPNLNPQLQQQRNQNQLNSSVPLNQMTAHQFQEYYRQYQQQWLTSQQNQQNSNQQQFQHQQNPQNQQLQNQFIQPNDHNVRGGIPFSQPQQLHQQQQQKQQQQQQPNPLQTNINRGTFDFSDFDLLSHPNQQRPGQQQYQLNQNHLPHQQNQNMPPNAINTTSGTSYPLFPNNPTQPQPTQPTQPTPQSTQTTQPPLQQSIPPPPPPPSQLPFRHQPPISNNMLANSNVPNSMMNPCLNQGSNTMSWQGQSTSTTLNQMGQIGQMNSMNQPVAGWSNHPQINQQQQYSQNYQQNPQQYYNNNMIMNNMMNPVLHQQQRHHQQHPLPSQSFNSEFQPPPPPL